MRVWHFIYVLNMIEIKTCTYKKYEKKNTKVLIPSINVASRKMSSEKQQKHEMKNISTTIKQ